MTTTKMPLSELIRPEKNVRIHTESQISEFVRSLKMFGQIRPIVVDESNTVLAGNGLLSALIKAGYAEADVLKIENLTEHQKKKLMIADNKIFSLGIENLATLNSFLDELQDDLDIPGYDEDILKSLVAEAEDVTEKISQYGTITKSEAQAIQESSEKREEKALAAIQREPSGESEDSTPEEAGCTLHSPYSAPADCIICPKCGEKICL